jgi:hypothetical protein
MSWRDLMPLDDWYEFQRPEISEAGEAGATDGQVRLYFTDDLSREWFAEWLRSKAGWSAFTAWADGKR